MSEALARVRNDSVASRRTAKDSAALTFLNRARAALACVPARVYLGAGVSAVIVGIAVNALTLQRGRHPAPLFAPAHQPASPAPTAAPPVHPRSAASIPAAPVSAPVEKAPPAPAVPLPPSAPRESAAAAAHPSDPIAELLRGEGPSDSSHLVLAAQNALIKLGYSLKADGREGPATAQALREFERAHKLAPSAEITTHLVKQLNAAVQNASR